MMNTAISTVWNESVGMPIIVWNASYYGTPSSEPSYHPK